ncbi:MAG TPA: hypothetical protein DG048_18870 [Pseudoalteromonas sp.]|nr:hypothetical protein [Pseudoalteromonas sp.]|tara:strand:- start:878 stop:1426 length:549 start_codon:yes stop_codon:yes gene_type:complete
MGLIPTDYELPVSNTTSKFGKLEMGENRFRFLATPTTCYRYWTEDMNGNSQKHVIKNASDAPSGEKPKHMWAFPAWMDGEVKLMEIDKATVLKELVKLDKSAEWGNLLHYDVIVTREGHQRDTTYSTQPCPKSELPDEAKSAWQSFKDSYDPESIFDAGETTTDPSNLPTNDNQSTTELPWE